MRTFLIVFLMTTSGIVTADWVRVATIDDTTVYADSASKENTPAGVKIWLMTDFKNPVEGALSVKFLQENNCSGGLERSTMMTRYKGHMGRGAVINDNWPEDDGWIPTTRDGVSKYICGKDLNVSE
jgi:hypothetical protein